MTRILIIVLALISGAATWYVLAKRPLSPEPQLETIQVKTIDILVYAQDLPQGARTGPAAFAWESRLEDTAPDGAIIRTDPDTPVPTTLSDKVLRTNVQAGAPVRVTQMADGVASHMALSLNKGMRAVAIRVTPEKIAGGFIMPDDQVDVIHTIVRDLDRDGVPNVSSQTILKSVRVLAVGEIATGSIKDDEGANSAQTVKGDTVTLEVDENQARILFAASATGQLSLALRSLGDEQNIGLSEITSVDDILPKMTSPARDQIEDTQNREASPEPEQAQDTQIGVDPKAKFSRVVIIEGNRRRMVEVPLSEPDQ